jgi:hypothetical protein
MTNDDVLYRSRLRLFGLARELGTLKARAPAPAVVAAGRISSASSSKQMRLKPCAILSLDDREGQVLSRT